MEFVPPAAAPAPGMSSAPAVPVRYAGFWLRWVACTIDGIIVSVPIFTIVMLAMLAGILRSGEEASPATIFIILMLIPLAFLLAWLYSAVQESSTAQATFGKRLLGLRVVDYAGGRIGFGRATGRYWSRILSGIPCNIGYIMAAFTERKQALHDIIAKTLVVRR